MALALVAVPARAAPVAVPDAVIVDAPAAPSPSEAEFYTRPLVRARLRLPDSLQDYRIVRLAPTVDDPERFEVEVQFRARTPFGGLTAHRAHFRMKRAASGQGWIVTAQ